MKNDPIEVSFVILLKGKFPPLIFELYAIFIAYNLFSKYNQSDLWHVKVFYNEDKVSWNSYLVNISLE